jgi:hypothetical protein
MNVRDRLPPGVQADAHAAATQRLAKDGTVVPISLTSTELLDADGHIYALATTERTQPQLHVHAATEVRHG